MLIKIAEKEYNENELAVLAKAGVLNIGQKNDPASTTLTAPALQGPFPGNANQFGIFSAPGVRPQRFGTLVRPRSLSRLLRLNQSVYTQEMLEVMTGLTSSAGATNATGFCGNPPTVGQAKVCQQNYYWGDYYMKTDLESLPQTGQLRARWEVPAELLNQAPSENQLMPDIMYRLTDPRSALMYELWRIGVDLERQLEQTLVMGAYTGNVSNTYTGFFHQFNGLDAQIKTGYRDQGSPGTPLCPAVDSSIISFNAAIDSVIGGGDGRNIVEAATDLYWAKQLDASKMGMDNTQWVWLMRQEQFKALTEVWACQYATYRCVSTNAGQPFVQDVQTSNALRIEMLSGQYLKINGLDIPVVFSDGIPNPAIANATYEADMYLTPISWQGLPLLRLEYFNMGNQYVSELANFVRPNTIQVLNNGMFQVGQRDTGLCIEFLLAARMRLILETPWLAGRIDNVNYGFRAPSREAIPGTSSYVNGGSTYRNPLIAQPL